VSIPVSGLGWPNDASSAVGDDSLTTVITQQKLLNETTGDACVSVAFYFKWTLTLLDGFDIHDLSFIYSPQLIPVAFSQLAT
jgi:hypothetical protein